jgi:16S rRNA (guanine(966)-N(2))-methyltransferase RsmD
MRITGGIGRGRKLKVPAGSKVRPTSDKVKQALFNILGDRVPGSVFLDLFAGAGGIGLEALSRGASQVVFVDGSRESLSVIKKNIEALKLTELAQVIAAQSEIFLRRPSGPYDIIFLDPPYKMELAPLLGQIAQADMLKPGGVVVAEHFKKQPSPERAGKLELFREAAYGDTVLAFYKAAAGSHDSAVGGQEEER